MGHSRDTYDLDQLPATTRELRKHRRSEGSQTPEHWCAEPALTVERCPDKSHPCTSAALRLAQSLSQHPRSDTSGDIPGTRDINSARPASLNMALNSGYTRGRERVRTFDRWCVKLGVHVQRRPDESHPCTSAAVCRLPPSQLRLAVAARLGTLGGHGRAGFCHVRRSIQQTSWLTTQQRETDETPRSSLRQPCRNPKTPPLDTAAVRCVPQTCGDRLVDPFNKSSDRQQPLVLPDERGQRGRSAWLMSANLAIIELDEVRERTPPRSAIFVFFDL